MSKKVLVKKIGVAVVAIALLMGTSAFVQMAEIIGTNVMVKAESSVQETQSGSFNYEENDDGGITITGFIGTETDVVIPNSIDNKTVTEIGDSAFRGCTGLKSINISDSITKIGWCAFFDCENLSTVVIPDGLVEIEDYAFEGCTSLSSITIPDSVQKIGYETFKRSDPIIYGTAGSYVHKYVLDNPYLSHFASANNKDFSIGLNDDDTIKIRNYIGTESDVVIPSEIDGILVTTVETFIFGSSVENVQTIILPESLTYIEENAFRFRPKIYGIEGSYANKYCNYYGYEFFSLSNKDYSIILNDDNTLSVKRCYIKDENIELPEKIGNMTVKSIEGYRSFEYADNIKSITIPKTFTDLDISPFGYCDKLESMYIHEDNPNYTSVDGVVYNKDITELVYFPHGKTGTYEFVNIT